MLRWSVWTYFKFSLVCLCKRRSNIYWFRELHASKYYLSLLRPSIFQLICLDRRETLPFSVPRPHFLVPFHVKESCSFSLFACKDRFNSAKTRCRRLQNFYMFSKLIILKEAYVLLFFTWQWIFDLSGDSHGCGLHGPVCCPGIVSISANSSLQHIHAFPRIGLVHVHVHVHVYVHVVLDTHVL